jgi:poly-gamma-glutamate synthesis protein (capsule biosynthesis protein)
MAARPDPDFKRFCRRLAGEGVDIVHGHSAHNFQGVEVHEGSLLCYDMGDFVDDYAVDRELRNDRGFIFDVEVGAAAGSNAGGGSKSEGGRADGVERLRLVPTEIYDRAAHLADGEVAAWSRERMRELSAEFGTEFERAGESLVLSV